MLAFSLDTTIYGSFPEIKGYLNGEQVAFVISQASGISGF